MQDSTKDYLKLALTALIVSAFLFVGAFSIFETKAVGRDLFVFAVVSLFMMVLLAPLAYRSIHRRLRKRWPSSFGPISNDETWDKFAADPPRQEFLVWTRRILFAACGLLFLIFLKGTIQEAQWIYSSTPSGPSRSNAVRELLGDLAQFVGVLAMLIAAWGYGIFPRPALTSPGYAVADWRARKRKRKNDSSPGQQGNSGA